MPRGGITGRRRGASSCGTPLKELEDVPPELENLFTLFDAEVSPEEEGEEEGEEREEEGETAGY